jgi:hypothetical protein
LPTFNPLLKPFLIYELEELALYSMVKFIEISAHRPTRLPGLADLGITPMRYTQKKINGQTIYPGEGHAYPESGGCLIWWEFFKTLVKCSCLLSQKN